MCVTGQYHKGDTKSTPTADADRRRTKRHETPSITLVASLARAPAGRSPRRTTRRLRSGGPPAPGHGRAAMVRHDSPDDGCPGEATRRRRSHAAPAIRTTVLRYA